MEKEFDGDRPASAPNLPTERGPMEPTPPQPSAGRIVRYVPYNSTDPAASNMAKVVPAIIVSIFDDTVNLQVFVDGDKGCVWKTSVKHSSDKLPGTWHWPMNRIA